MQSDAPDVIMRIPMHSAWRVPRCVRCDAPPDALNMTRTRCLRWHAQPVH